MNEFIAAAHRNDLEKTERYEDSSRILPFGVPVLDAILDGLLPTDLLLIGAATGRGKSEMAVEVAMNVSRAYKPFKRVHFFALEAEQNEVERRIKYKIISQKYYADGHKEPISYQGWRMSQHPELFQYEDFADKEVLSLTNLFTFYRGNHFDITSFEKQFSSLEGQSDLVIIDHIGFIDFDSPNENKAVTDIVKRIRDLALILRIPVIAIAHLRKQNKKEPTIIPSIDDFHGSSNLVKVATRVVILGNGGIDESTKFPVTYVRLVKNRFGSERTFVVLKTLFDTRKNCYIKKFKYGYLNANETQWIEMLAPPAWAKIY